MSQGQILNFTKIGGGLFHEGKVQSYQHQMYKASMGKGGSGENLNQCCSMVFSGITSIKISNINIEVQLWNHLKKESNAKMAEEGGGGRSCVKPSNPHSGSSPVSSAETTFS